jgi:hypothetical protein
MRIIEVQLGDHTTMVQEPETCQTCGQSMSDVVMYGEVCTNHSCPDSPFYTTTTTHD